MNKLKTKEISQTKQSNPTTPSPRPSQRQADELRKITFEHMFGEFAEGSILVGFGKTRVLCTASITPGVPRFLKDSRQGWLTAEYGMLPRSTHDRMQRESSRGKQSGRTLEIQRLIGRSLRACLDLKKLGDFTIHIDCDVLQADGGTRTAAITGSCVALIQALRTMQRKKIIKSDPFIKMIAAVSVGIVNGQPVTDLDYTEDSNAETDMNVIMDETGKFIEIQGTAEQQAFDRQQLDVMLELAQASIFELLELQREALANM